MKRKAWIIGLSVIAVASLCVAALFIFDPISQDTPTKPVSASLTNSAGTGLIRGIDIFDIDEYNDFVATEQNLPDNFVTLDMLDGFGSFDGFICHNFYPDFSSYAYFFDDENGEGFTFWISTDPKSEQKNMKTLSISKAETTMQNLVTEDSGIILRNGVCYKYDRGKLTSIEWEINGISFDVNLEYDSIFSADGKEYPALPEDSMFKRLVSTSEAEFTAALNELSAIVSKNGHVTE